MQGDDFADGYEDYDAETCWACGGDGYIHDCGEDTCCCAHPDEDECYPCDECGGTGTAR